jgi:UPF0755 protein
MPKRMIRRIVEAVIPTAVGVLAFLLLDNLGWMYSPHTNWSDKVIEVPRGATLSWVSKRLAEEGVIDDSTRFEMVARIIGDSGDLKAGTYRFPAETSPQEVLSKLTTGDTYAYKLTVPEGLRIEQVAELVDGVPWMDGAGFVEIAKDAAFAQSLGVEAESLEGYLFPDTYFVDANTSVEDLIRRMVEECLGVVAEIAREQSPPFDYSIHQVLTLASIVEAEVMIPRERPRVAAVFLNRLKIGWKLQADPTVRYALNKYGVRLSLDDLKVESDYNTYLHHGLPPGPICNPSRGSIRAIFDPLDGCQDLFFVATGRGDHIFSRTEAEHLRARALIKSRRGR